MNGFQNPYVNPYNIGSFQPFQPVQPAQKTVDKVNGRNGAMQYPIGPNSQAWILDESGLVSWLVITDSAGYRTVTAYDIAPHEDTPAPDYGTLETRIAKLEEIVNGNTGNTSAVRKKPTGGKPDDGTD